VRPGDVVVAAKPDRMFRSARDALNVIGDFQRRGIGLWLLDIGECSGNGVSQVVITIMSVVADFERGRISERIKDAKLAARRDNRHLGGTVQFGFDLGADGKLVPNPVQQAAIGARSNGTRIFVA
jgi:putative DNA-invertase from lambdoid prophage Rac